MSDEIKRCPACGAVLTSTETCEELFWQTQAQELADPAYYAAHHLVVPCYMIQHDAYTEQGLWPVRDLLQRFLQGLDPQHWRRTEGRRVDNRQREFSLTRGERLDALALIDWSFVVSDVRLDSAEHYCQDARRWATSVLADTAHLRRQQD